MAIDSHLNAFRALWRLPIRSKIGVHAIQPLLIKPKPIGSQYVDNYSDENHKNVQVMVREIARLLLIKIIVFYWLFISKSKVFELNVNGNKFFVEYPWD